MNRLREGIVTATSLNGYEAADQAVDVEREGISGEAIAVIELSELLKLRQELSDYLHCPAELPEQFITNDPNYRHYKFRAAWFQGALSLIQVAAEDTSNEKLMLKAMQLAEKEELNYPKIELQRRNS